MDVSRGSLVSLNSAVLAGIQLEIDVALLSPLGVKCVHTGFSKSALLAAIVA